MLKYFSITKILATTLLIFPLTVISATFTTDTHLDYVDINPGDGICDRLSTEAVSCSLRAAIQEANLTPEDDTIILPKLSFQYVMTIGNAESEDENVSGDFDILQGTITLEGEGPTLTIVDANSVDRVFDVKFGAKLVLNNLAVTEGNSLPQTIEGGLQIQTDGGGVRNLQGTLILNNVHIHHNKAHNLGPGIYFQGTSSGNLYDSVGYLEINNSQIYSNSSSISNGLGVGVAINGGTAVINGTLIKDNPAGSVERAILGGGIYSIGNITIKNSAIIDNRSMTDGGGIYHLLGEFTMINTTVSNNDAIRSGGGLYFRQGYVGMPDFAAQNKIDLTNVTMINNASSGVDNSGMTMGGGGGMITGPAGTGVLGGKDIAVSGQDSQIENKLSIVNSIVNDCVTHANASIVSAGNNISTGSSCNFILTSDKQNTDPMLNPIANNGSYLSSYAPMVGSPALDSASDWYCPETDQRSVLRPTTLCDIGAYEEMPLVATPYIYIANPGAPLDGVLRTHYTDTSDLTFEIVTQPSKGSLGFYPVVDPVKNPYINGQFAYVADLNTSGTDSFTFRACNNVTFECSNTAEITIEIQSATVTEEIRVNVIDDGGAAASVLTVVQTNLSAEIADVDFTTPLGLFFFDVKDIPINETSSVLIQIDFPWTETTFPSGSRIRKLDLTGQWRTLPTSGTGTYASINYPMKRITMRLFDNDGVYDSNPAVGIISDPFSLGVAIAEEDKIDINATTINNITAGNNGESAASSPQNDPNALILSKGAGTISYLIFSLFLFLSFRKRKS